MKSILFLGFVLLSLFVAGCTSVLPEKVCSVDTDCVPATCCHARDTVGKDYAPDCGEALCTAVCEPGTLDCNQGKIECVRGECAVVLVE